MTAGTTNAFRLNMSNSTVQRSAIILFLLSYSTARLSNVILGHVSWTNGDISVDCASCTMHGRPQCAPALHCTAHALQGGMHDAVNNLGMPMSEVQFEPVHVLVLDRAGPRPDRMVSDFFLDRHRSVRGVFHAAICRDVNFRDQGTRLNLVVSINILVSPPQCRRVARDTRANNVGRQCWLSFLSADIVGRQWVTLSFAETKAETFVCDQKTGLRPN